MLADPRRKQKLSADPRNLAWQNDENKFGHKLMEKMGWSSGTGLGANGMGNIEPIRVQLKADNRGVGCTRNYADNWIAHQDDFNSLLASLNSMDGDSGGSDPQAIQVQKLEEKSKNAKGRVHYMKFAKGKDLSVKTTNDLDCIFGKRKSKSAPITPQARSGANSEDEDSEKPKENVMTFTSTSSVQEYFAKKMAAFKLHTRGNQGSTEEGLGITHGSIDRDEDAPCTGFVRGLDVSMDAGRSYDTAPGIKIANANDVECEVSSSEEKLKRKKKKAKKMKTREEEDNYPLKEDTVSVEVVSTPLKKTKKKKKREKKEVVREEVKEESESGSYDEPSKKCKKKNDRGVKEEVKEENSDGNEGCCNDEPNKSKKKKTKDPDIESTPASPQLGVGIEESKKDKKSRKRKAVKEDAYVDNVEESVNKKCKSNVVEDMKLAGIIEHLEGKTRKVAMTVATLSDAKEGTIMKWEIKPVKPKGNQTGFTQSNFLGIKGYGQGFNQNLILTSLPKEGMKDNKSKKKGVKSKKS